VSALRLLHADPKVMATLAADGLPRPPEETRAFLERATDHWLRHGFGLWMFQTRDGGEPVGYCGLHRTRHEGALEIELLYGVRSGLWRQAMATEMASTVLEAAREWLALDRLIAFTLPHNAGSRRLLEKVGFDLSGETQRAGLPHVWYRRLLEQRRSLEPPIPREVRAIDWRTWRARDEATLVFARRGAELLLIRKKRGLGAGKINGPGGRLEPGETPVEGAIREVEEELLVTPSDLRYCGDNRFQFVDGYSIHVHVFVAEGLSGEPSETAEAVPLWSSVDDLPFDEMWEDDRLWLPMALEGRRFSARYVFEGDRMLDHLISPWDRIPPAVPRGGTA
jgi:8-oxo-dGTP diphosphatase